MKEKLAQLLESLKANKGTVITIGALIGVVVAAVVVPIVDSILSLINYIALHLAGFRITSSTSNDMFSAIYRFWWGTAVEEKTK